MAWIWRRWQARSLLCRAVPGRFEPVDQGQSFLVAVDYAHTDDALRNAIQTARSLAKGKVITLFGCGGDRDRTKRPLMGMAAAELSDFVVLTSDNPRSEDPLSIMNGRDGRFAALRHPARRRARPRQGDSTGDPGGPAGRCGAAGRQRPRNVPDPEGPYDSFRRSRNGARGSSIIWIQDPGDQRKAE